jgi:hypothetical protein
MDLQEAATPTSTNGKPQVSLCRGFITPSSACSSSLNTLYDAVCHQRAQLHTAVLKHDTCVRSSIFHARICSI